MLHQMYDGFQLCQLYIFEVLWWDTQNSSSHFHKGTGSWSNYNIANEDSGGSIENIDRTFCLKYACSAYKIKGSSCSTII